MKHFTTVFNIRSFISIGAVFISILGAQDTTGPIPADVLPQNFTDRILEFEAIADLNPNENNVSLPNWEVNLNPSSDYLPNKKLTYAKTATGNSGRRFLGVRINFPDVSANSYAVANPRYPIGFYSPQTNLLVGNESAGVITNVGAIVSATTRVSGRNYRPKLFVTLVRSQGGEILMDFGELLFAGWRELTWNNINYLSDYRDRTFVTTPLYPRLIPSIKIKDFIFFRSYELPPGNVVSYLDYVDVRYDKAYAEEELDTIRSEPDYVDDEALWNIIKNETGGREAVLIQRRVDELRRLERLERLKMNLPVDPLPNTP